MAFVTPFLSSALTRSSLHGARVTTPPTTPAPALRMAASPSVPFLPKPEKLSEDMPGYAGFDPLGFSNIFNIKFLQEAEIKHARVCMLAVVGMLVAEQIQLPFYAGAPRLARDVHDWGVSQGSMNQLLLWVCIWETIVGLPALVQMMTLDSPRKPGEYAFDPLGLGKNPASYKKYQTNEIKNGRLAMIAVGGLIHQEFITGMTPVQQLLSGKFLP